MSRNCNTCNIEIARNNYLKDRTVCKSCYNKSRRKTNSNTLIRSEQLKSDIDKKKRKVVNSVNKTNNNKKNKNSLNL